MAPQAEQMQIVVASSCYCFASVGMLLFNKFAVQDFPLDSWETGGCGQCGRPKTIGIGPDRSGKIIPGDYLTLYIYIQYLCYLMLFDVVCITFPQPPTPQECCLVWAQLFFAASCLSLFAFPYIHVGSARDLFRWCMVVPFYCGAWDWLILVVFEVGILGGEQNQGI